VKIPPVLVTMLAAHVLLMMLVKATLMRWWVWTQNWHHCCYCYCYCHWLDWTLIAPNMLCVADG
jgi:hypothetical protein